MSLPLLLVSSAHCLPTLQIYLIAVDVMAATHELKIENIFSVEGHVCVVTGGGTGIGLMATQALAANGIILCHPAFA